MTDDHERRAPMALIAAGGSGERLGADGPKALVRCADRSLLAWTLAAFADSRATAGVVVAVVESERDAFEREVAPARERGLSVTLCAGGPSRSHSVRAALAKAVELADPELVVVHDAARPLVASKLIDDCLGLLARDAETHAVVAAAPVTDTIKRAGADHVVEATLDRSALWAVQTPQAFRVDALARALGLRPDAPVEDADIASATDDASLIERGGGRVVVMPWTEPNPKVTTPVDLDLAERLLAERAALPQRR